MRHVRDAGGASELPCAWAALVVTVVEMMLRIWYEPPGTITPTHVLPANVVRRLEASSTRLEESF